MIRHAFRSFASILRRFKQWHLCYVSLFLCVSAYSLLRWPIVTGDTDLWYHLNGGRYVFDHHAIPSTSFFSFISPPRAWVDYYWLFQVLVYQLYLKTDYYGLIVFRTVLYLASGFLIFRYLLRGEQGSPSRWYFSLVGALCFAVLLPRCLLVRPHLFTYLFLITFLYVLEFRPTNAIILIPLSLLWCNVHGLAYPMMLLVSGSYIGEYFMRRLTDPLVNHEHIRRFLIPTTLSLLTVYLTPHGYRLPELLFTSINYAAKFINEYQPITLLGLSSLMISRLIPSPGTVFNLVLFAACLAVITSILRRQIRISHLLLWAGGLLLLTKGVRFTNECALLVLPVIKANPLGGWRSTSSFDSLRSLRTTLSKGPRPEAMGRVEGSNRTTSPAIVIVTLLVLMVPLRFIQDFLQSPSRYPFSHRGLPVGVARFLNHVHVGGSILNDPNSGGYLEWMLYPRYKIFMDMEIPFLFNDEDFHLSGNMFADETVLRRMLSQYDPAFLAVSIRHNRSKEVMKQFPEYAVVFFDDEEVLYLNTRRHPALARTYELSGLDPHELIWKNFAETSYEGKEWDWLSHLSTMLEIDPDSGILNELAAWIHLRSRAHDRALPAAETVIRNFPELPIGYLLKGDAVRGVGRFDLAARLYAIALDKTVAGEKPSVYERLGSTYLELRQYQQAYAAFQRSIDVFSPFTPVDRLYNLGSVACLARNTKEAAAIFGYLYNYRIAPDDVVWRERLKRNLTSLGVPPK